MYVDHTRATVVFDTLVATIIAKKFPYDGANTPQSIVSKGLAKYTDKQRSLFWFFLCMYMRGPVKSNYAAKKLFEIFEAQGGGGIFDPDCRYSSMPDCIDVVMESFGFTRLLSDVKKFWPHASKLLASSYGGDPRNIFDNINSFDDIEARVRHDKKIGTGFLGFQKKMSSMLAYFLRDQELIDLQDFPPPVDFHLMRIMVLTGVLKFEDADPRKFRYETSSILGYTAIESYQARTGVDPILLGDALWLLSGNLCSLSPKNQEHLAFGTFCEDTIRNAPVSKKKRLVKHPGLFAHHDIGLYLNVNTLSHRMRQTCGKCPANEFCKGRIPAVEYYNYGLLEYTEDI